MDMKKILQAMDGASKPVVKADNDMKRFVSIIAEAGQVSPRFGGVQTTTDDDGSTTTDYQAGPLQTTKKVDAQGRPIKTTAQYDLGVGKLGAEQDHVSGITTKTATPADPNADPNAMLPTSNIAAARGVDPKKFAAFQKQATVKESGISKYFEEVEKEILETQNLKKQKVKKLSERVIERVIPGQETPPGINRLTGRPIDPNATSIEPPSLPRSSSLTPGVTYPAAYTIDYNGKQYKFAGKDKVGSGQGEIITVQAGAIGIRGLVPVKVQLENDGMYYEISEQGIKEAGGNYGHHSNIKRHVAQSKRPPDNIVQMAKSGARVDNNRRFNLEDTDGTDSVSLDIPLLIRLFEFAREDAKDDMTLHTVAEKLIALSKNGQTLSMDQYDAIVGNQKEPQMKEGKQRLDPSCWNGYKKQGTKVKGGITVNNCVKK